MDDPEENEASAKEAADAALGLTAWRAELRRELRAIWRSAVGHRDLPAIEDAIMRPAARGEREPASVETLNRVKAILHGSFMELRSCEADAPAAGMFTLLDVARFSVSATLARLKARYLFCDIAPSGRVRFLANEPRSSTLTSFSNTHRLRFSKRAVS